MHETGEPADPTKTYGICTCFVMRKKFYYFIALHIHTWEVPETQPQSHAVVLRAAPLGQWVFSALWECNNSC